MGRLLIFIAGLVVGAVGTYVLMHRVEVPAPTAIVARPTAPPVTNGMLPAPAPGPAPTPAPVSGPTPIAVPSTLALAPPASTANTSEQGVASTPEAAAALAAADSAAATPGGQLLLPVQGVEASQLVDTFTQSRGEGRLHDAIDIMANRGTPVLAVADGRVAKLFNSKPGGLTVYQFDREEKLAYYYAHLDRYADNLAEGRQLKRGEVLGYVGSTGNASESAPHLHFAVFVLGPDKRWWQGTAVNPYPLLGGK